MPLKILLSVFWIASVPLDGRDWRSQSCCGLYARSHRRHHSRWLLRAVYTQPLVFLMTSTRHANDVETVGGKNAILCAPFNASSLTRRCAGTSVLFFPSTPNFCLHFSLEVKIRVRVKPPRLMPIWKHAVLLSHEPNGNKCHKDPLMQPRGTQCVWLKAWRRINET